MANNHSTSNTTPTAASAKTLPNITVSYVSENAVLLEWPEKVDAIQHQHIMFCETQIHQALANTIIESIASYASLLIYYNFTTITQHTLNTLLHKVITTPYCSHNDGAPIISATASTTAISTTATSNNSNSPIEIPVYYGEEAGWDLAYVAEQTQHSIQEVINLHTQTQYHAYALGFTPGFCYLGELPTVLQLPRKSSPRIAVPKGAVAIAQQQTAVYPAASPGGWHIIGQTPIAMYSVANQQFESTITVGQTIIFTAITKAEFLALGGQIVKEVD